MARPFQNRIPVVSPKSKQEHNDYLKSINNLLKIKAISQCSHVKDEFISSVFLIPKVNGEKRFILNLKELNKFVKTCHFKMEDYRTASKFVTQNCYMATLDMKDAYFLLPIHEDHKKYLRFEYDHILYEFNCLPFGLSTAPFVFTKLMKPVVQKLRLNGFMSTIYLDDIFLVDRTYYECQQNINFTKTLLVDLGFVINFEKSCLEPKQQCKYLGFIFDSYEMTLKLPDSKIIALKKLLSGFKKMSKCNLRDFAKFLGHLTSVCPAIQYGWLYTKLFERHKYLCLCKNPSYNQTISLPDHFKEDITWWEMNINSNSPFKFNQFQLEIYSDASSSGWGAYCEGNKAHGFWKLEERNMHINFLEIRAAFLGLKTFANNKHCCEILLRIDNVTAISCINRMGSIKYSHLNQITREIWQWCEERRITLFASYINTRDNCEADELSRKHFADTEWELCAEAYQTICNRFGSAVIDLFASRCNAKCPTYVSWKNDPDAWAVDAFTVSWKNMFFYAFPPFSLIQKTLQKVITDRASGIIVVPHWPTQPWFPILQKIASSDYIHFSPSDNLLTSPFRLPHNLSKTLTLVAVKLSGDLYHKNR